MNNTLIDQRNEILSVIITTCLWSEPQQLEEILLNLENQFPIDDKSRDDFLKCTSLVLGEAIKAGLIRRKSGFFMLTAEGRKKVEVDQYSVFKNVFSSLS
jgi:hypothetical protein